MSRYTLLLVVILFTAAVLRFVGLNPGYHQFHPDESTIYSAAVDFIKNNNFQPVHYEYPSLTNYINYVFFKVIFIPLGWLKYFVLHLSELLDGNIKIPLGKDIYNKIFQLEILGRQDINALFWGRYVTAFFGVLGVWATYLVGRKLFDKETALVSALLVCVNYRHVLNSHLGLPDIYNSFLFLLAFWSVLHLRDKITSSRLLLCGVFIGLYISTKYQIYPLIPLGVVILERALKKENLKEKILAIFDFRMLMVPLIGIVVFVLLNPYLFINFEIAVKQISYASLKYGAGVMKIMPYAYWYLFNIGIGRITTFLIFAGIVFGLLRSRIKLVLLLSVIIPFFLFFTYLTGGGFYTRNFISITPFLLIFAGYAIFQVANIQPRKLFIPLVSVLLALAVWENLASSLIVVRQYSQPWNRTLVANWLSQNTPSNAVVAAHPSVPIPGDRVRIDYDRFPWPNFSLAEFAESGASFAVTNLDWMDSDFYGWMRSEYGWTKPTREMKNSYVAMTLNELTDFGLYEAIKPWQAPDSNFIVAKVPRYSVISKNIFQEFSFDNAKDITYWQSEPVKVEGWNGFEVKYRTKLDSGGQSYKDGYIFAKFFASYGDAIKGEDYDAIRLSGRDDKSGIWVDKNLIGKIPKGNGYLVLGFSVYDKNRAKYYLDKISLYNAEVLEDLGGANIHKINIDENVLLPNSHGNL